MYVVPFQSGFLIDCGACGLDVVCREGSRVAFYGVCVCFRWWGGGAAEA